MDEILALLKEMRKTRISHEELIFLRELIEEKKLEKESWRAIRNKVISGTVWAGLAATFMACLFAFKQWLLGNF